MYKRVYIYIFICIFHSVLESEGAWPDDDCDASSASFLAAAQRKLKYNTFMYMYEYMATISRLLQL